MKCKCPDDGPGIFVPRGLVVSSPLGFQNTSGGGRSLPITKLGLRINRGAADGLAHNFTFRAANPSARLRVSFQVQFESDSGTELTIANVTWQLKAYLKNASTGKSSPGQLIYGPKAAPDGYEVDTADKDIQGTVFIPTTSTYGFAVGDGGQWVIQATWEPNESVDDTELAALFASCALNIDGAPVATTFL